MDVEGAGRERLLDDPPQAGRAKPRAIPNLTRQNTTTHNQDKPPADRWRVLFLVSVKRHHRLSHLLLAGETRWAMQI